jgi:hypothetical protein
MGWGPQVEWDKDWWQAVVKKIKLKQAGGQ